MTQIGETILLSGQQRVLGARLRLDDMLAGVVQLDAIGYRSLEAWGGVTFEACLRYLNENPWDRLRKIKAKAPKTPLLMPMCGRALVCAGMQADDVVEAFVRTTAENGIDIYRIYDPLNRAENLELAVKAVVKAGKRAEGVILLDPSTEQKLDDIGRFASELKDLGCQSLCLADRVGLLPPKRAGEWVAAVKKTTDLPLAMTVSDGVGTAAAAYVAGVQAGVDVIDGTLSAFASAVTEPPTESLVRILFEDVGLKLEAFEEASLSFAKMRERYAARVNRFVNWVHTWVLRHKLPATTIADAGAELEARDKLDKLDDVLAEVVRIHGDLGYAPLVMPVRGIVLRQAIVNVLDKRRYVDLDPDLARLALGRYGTLPKPTAGVLREAAESLVTKDEIGEALTLDAVQKKHGKLVRSDEDALTLAMYPDAGARFLEGSAKAEALDSRPTRAYDVVVEGQAFHVEVHPSKPGVTVVPTGATAKKVLRPAPNRPTPKPAAPSQAPRAAQPAPVKKAPAPKPAPPTDPKVAAANGDEGNGGSFMVTCPMQGTILKMLVAVGDSVTRGQKIAVLEAMKMENDVYSGEAGVVVRLLVAQGEAVVSSQALLELET